MYGATSTLLGLQGLYHGGTKALLAVSRDGGERVQTGAYGPTHITYHTERRIITHELQRDASAFRCLPHSPSRLPEMMDLYIFGRAAVVQTEAQENARKWLIVAAQGAGRRRFRGEAARWEYV